MSYPPPLSDPTQHDSHASELAAFFHPSTHWTSSWYHDSSSSGSFIMPPPLEGCKDVSYATSWSSRGTDKTMSWAVLFSDLSVCWISVQFSTHPNSVTRDDPNDPSRVQRSATYLGTPAALDEQTLKTASEVYGERVAMFAEDALASGAYVARGECWDMANEALKAVTSPTYNGVGVPPSIPSLSRTHGHLIFEARAGVGARWRGGDREVRRGDIVEWRTVRVDRAGGGYAMLGDPEHTAVVVGVSTTGAASTVEGQMVSIASTGLTLEVVEQSVSTGMGPKKATYELARMTAGEVWVYRPLGWADYLGFAPDESNGGLRVPIECPQDELQAAGKVVSGW